MTDHEKTAPEEKLLTAEQAAAFLCVSESWLAKARLRGDGPRFLKIGRSVRYGTAHLRDFVRSRTRNSTSDG